MKLIVVVAEAEADRKQVCELIDRKILHHAPAWLDAEQLPHEREYRGLSPGTLFTRWREIRTLAVEPFGLRRSIGPIGFRGGDERRYDFPATRKVLILCGLMNPRPDAVLLIRDLDDQADARRISIEQARTESRGAHMEIVLALPNPKREAWVLNGFEYCSAEEEQRLSQLRRELHFDPCQQAERLDANDQGALRDAKRVLKVLSDGDSARQAKCWTDTAWSVLRQRGARTGLSLFLGDVKARLVPLVTGNPR